MERDAALQISHVLLERDSRSTIFVIHIRRPDDDRGVPGQSLQPARGELHANSHPLRLDQRGDYAAKMNKSRKIWKNENTGRSICVNH